MHKYAQTMSVHLVAFRKGERLAHKAPHALPQRVIPPFDVAGLPGVLATGPMLDLGDDLLVRLPDVGEDLALPLGRRNALPQAATRRSAPIATGIGHNLSRPSAYGQPDPAFPAALIDIGPQFVEFEHIIRPCWYQRRGERGQACRFFLTTPSGCCAKCRRSGRRRAWRRARDTQRVLGLERRRCRLHYRDGRRRCARSHGIDSAACHCASVHSGSGWDSYSGHRK